VLHDKYGTNLIGEFKIGRATSMPRWHGRRTDLHAASPPPIRGCPECRGVVSVYDQRSDTVTIWSSTQVVHWVRREASTVLNLPEARIRCVALDVGGGFGLKGHVYPEDLLIPFLARATNRPIRWIEDRHEHFMCLPISRWDSRLSRFHDQGRLLAFRDSHRDCGA
jgi:carbon-monoxide dehydrogenase large subunit